MDWLKRRRDNERDSDVTLVLGLGNPGRQYDGTRHNVGFMIVDEIARRRGGTFKGSRHRADTVRVDAHGKTLLLAKPVTFMNESGFAARHLVDYFRIPVSNVVVVCDDIDLPYGTIRIRPSGGSGGNGGLKSIIRELGTEDFCRLRAGVSRPANSAVKHVLGRFDGEQSTMLAAFVSLAADATEAIPRIGVAEAMNEFNRNWIDELRSRSSTLSV